MSPEPVTLAFRPAAIGGTLRRDDGERRAAGYAAGWAAGARAAAEEAAATERRRAEEIAQVEVRRDAAVERAVATLAEAAAALGRRQAVDDLVMATAIQTAALDLAEAVLAHELRPGPDSAAVLLERALALPADEGLHTIRVSPADIAAVQAVLDAGSATLPDGVRLVSDAALQPGDVIAEHATVVLDGRVRAALDRARAALEDS